MRPALALIGLVLVLGACATGDEDRSAAAPPIRLDERSRASLPDPAADFDALEDELIAAHEIHVGFVITSHGPFASDLRGELITRRDLGTRLWARGQFGGRPVDLELNQQTPGLLHLRAGTKSLEATAPPAVREALLLGMMRMGLLHNLALLTGLQAPERAAGGFRSMASCLCFARRAAATSVFKIFFGGKFVADAELDLGSSGWPAERRQTVYFEGGSMTVVERYEIFAVQDRPLGAEQPD